MNGRRGPRTEEGAISLDMYDPPNPSSPASPLPPLNHSLQNIEIDLRSHRQKIIHELIGFPSHGWAADRFSLSWVAS